MNKKVKPLKYFDRSSNQVVEEIIYGQKWLYWLYTTLLGRLFLKLMTKSFVSRWYGKFQDASWTKRYIPQFIKDYSIDIDEYRHGSLAHNKKEQSYSCFNEFFIRQLEDGARNFVKDEHLMPAPSEARYFAFEKVNKSQAFPIKGEFLSSEALLNNNKWHEAFESGPIMIARLAPVDYHRFHYPVEGKALDYWEVTGKLYSVNPLALQYKPDILATNHRAITIVENSKWGLIAIIEVGATMVGKIVQTHDLESDFARGQEKGYFLFGASTVIILGQKGKWIPAKDLLEHTAQGMETRIKLGEPVAHLL